VSIEQRRVVRTELPGPASVALAGRRRAEVSAAVSGGNDIYVREAGGAILVDVDGNQLIDFGSGIGVASIGHSHPKVVEAVTAQASGYGHTCFMVSPYDGYLDLCHELNARTPGDFEKHSVLLNSGAEAVENAVKIARAHTGRPAVVVFDHAYHGRTNLTMAMTAKVQPYKDGFGPFAPEVYRMPMAYPYRWPGGAERCAGEAFAEFASKVHLQVGEEHVAAVVLEPIQGGFIVPPPGFLASLREWCDQHGVVLVADEIQSGFCRTGDWFAVDHENVVPDLVTSAKALGGGLPIAAVTGRAEIMDAPVPGGLGGTFGGNPLSCAASLAAIGVMESEGLAGRARQLGEILTRRLGELAASFPQVGEIRGRGAMMAIELVVPDGSRTPDAALAKAVVAGCARRGVVMLSCGSYGNVIRMLPPLVTSFDLVDDAMDVLAEAFAEAAG
jgi:4-aminobutyrate aminotransferase/(S)-3-amino-2-methylpropionate transaminase